MEFDAVARHEVAALKLPLSPCDLRGQYACDGEQDREEDTMLFHNVQLLFVEWLWVRVPHLISNTMMPPNAAVERAPPLEHLVRISQPCPLSTGCPLTYQYPLCFSFCFSLFIIKKRKHAGLRERHDRAYRIFF